MPWGVALAEVAVPGVEVRVEVDEGERTIAARGGAQQRQRDGVVAPDGDEPAAAGQEGVGAPLDLGDCLLRAERGARDVPRVHDLGQFEGQRAECGMVGAE